MVGMFGIISGAAVLAAAVQESVGGHRMEVGHGYSGYVIYDPKMQPVRPGHGGLFISMDGGLPVA